MIQSLINPKRRVASGFPEFQRPEFPEARRRIHRSMDEARSLVADWRASGQPKDAWCLQRGLNRSTLYACLRRCAGAEGAVTATNPFIELHPPQPTPSLRRVRLILGDSAAVAELSIEDLVAVIQRIQGRQP